MRGRLARTSNPKLDLAERKRLVGDLMDARRAVAAARRMNDDDAEGHLRNGYLPICRDGGGERDLLLQGAPQKSP